MVKFRIFIPELWDFIHQIARDFKASLYKYCMNVDDGRIIRSWRSCLSKLNYNKYIISFLIKFDPNLSAKSTIYTISKYIYICNKEQNNFLDLYIIKQYRINTLLSIISAYVRTSSRTSLISRIVNRSSLTGGNL